VAVDDDAAGKGFLMYTRMDTQARFSAISQNSSNLIAVRNSGQGWQYNDNDRWISFATMAGDHLLAEIDFGADTIKSLEGETGVFDGVELGFIDSDLDFFANRFNGVGNSGEFEVTGTYFAS
jgi:hypothetical protein